MNTRCYRCGWSLSLSRETIAAALANANATGTKHHVERCPRCRQTIKIPIDQLKRFAPQGVTALETQPQAMPLASSTPPAATETTKAAEVSPSPSLATSPEIATVSPASEKLEAQPVKSLGKSSAEPKKKTSAKSPVTTKTNKPAAKKPAAKKKTSSE